MFLTLVILIWTPILSPSQSLNVGNQGLELLLVVHDPGERRHNGTRHQVSWISEVSPVPLRIVFAAHARKIRARPLRPEHMRIVVDELVGSRNRRIYTAPARPLHVRQQSPGLLCMAVPAALTDINSTSLQLLRCILLQLAGRS